MKRHLQRVATRLTLLLAAGAMLASYGAAAVANAPALSGTSTSMAGTAEFAACLKGQHAADVVLLIDESGSLKQSDPAGQRVLAATSLLRSWKTLSDNTNYKINVETMGFSEATTPGPWRSAGTQSAELLSDVESFSNRNTGQQTDYWMALNGARQQLAARAPDGGTCQAIVWFSDGKLDAFPEYTVGGRTAVKPYLAKKGSNAAATKAAAEDVCRAGGLVDQVRTSEISLFAIGLNAVTSKAEDFDLMKSIATGVSSCGKSSATGRGWFTLATNVSDLVAAFDELGKPGSEKREIVTKICQVRICKEFAHTFVLDGSLTWVHILARSHVAGLDLYLISPDGKEAKVADKFTLGAVTGQANDYLRDGSGGGYLSTVDLFQPQGNWAGQWSLVFVDPAGKSQGEEGRTSISMATDLTPTLTLPTSARAGGQVEGASLGLTRTTGVKIDTATLKSSIALAAVLTDSAGAKTPLLTAGSLADVGKPLTVDLSTVAPGRASIEVSATVTTAPTKVGKRDVPGTTFQPAIAQYAVTILPPLGYPVVETTKLRFGAWKDKGGAKLTSVLALQGPGCVWLGGNTVGAAPPKIGDVSIAGLSNAPGSAVCLAENETKSVPLTLSTAAGGSGAIVGSLRLVTAPKENLASTRDANIAFDASMDPPPNTGVGWLVGGIAFFLGLGLPLAMMYLLKRRSAVLRPYAGLLGSELPLKVGATGISREDGSSGLLTDYDLRDTLIVPVNGTRKLDVGTATVVTRTGKSPLGSPSARISAPGMVAVSSVSATPRPDGSAVLPLALHNSWVLLHDPTGPAERVSLVIFAPVGESRTQLIGRLDEAVRDIPDLVQRIRAANGGRPDAAPGDADPFRSPTQAGAPATDPFASDFHTDLHTEGSGDEPVATDLFATDPFAADPFASNPSAGTGGGSPQSAPAQAWTFAAEEQATGGDDAGVARTRPRSSVQPPRADQAAQHQPAQPSDDPFAIDLSGLLDNPNP